MEKIQYEKYNWNICRDLKDIAVLLGYQLGYTMFCCFRCEQENITAIKDTGLNKNPLFQVRKCNKYSINQPEKLFTPLHINFIQGNGSKYHWIYVFEKYFSQGK